MGKNLNYPIHSKQKKRIKVKVISKVHQELYIIDHGW